MASIAIQGYRVRGINNVTIRLYPQVLGIHKVHEHNLCNALRDFGLMLKSEWNELLQYSYDFLKFVPTMRSSELCMIAHGYSLLQLNDRDWWDQFSSLASKASYDMDGKEIAGLLYSLSNVYKGQHPLIIKLMEESKPWIQHASPATLSLLVKVIANLKVKGNFLYSINRRAMEIIDQLNMVDVIFFVTSNTEAKTQDIELYRTLCVRAMQLYDHMELHHVRALAASLSIGGYKSHTFFNILSLRLLDISKVKKLRDSDVISLFLAYTSQKFLMQNDLCFDTNLYKTFIKERFGTAGKDKFLFPIPESGPVLIQALRDNIERITANGMPIVLRAISILNLPADKSLYDTCIDKTARYIREMKYDGLKLSNLVVTIARRHERHDEFWRAVHDVLKEPAHGLDPDLVAKMTSTLTSITNDEYKYTVYKDLIRLSLLHCKRMSEKSLFALTRAYVATMEIEALCSASYVDAIIALMQKVTLSDSYNLLKLYPFKMVSMKDENVIRLVQAAQTKLDRSEREASCYRLMESLLQVATR
ncbi:hypothetical protein X943_002245 [Babesia divergens]|uniref:RNA-editing substrate-binding complex 6 protein domain-containing protein n=1 Tax=Babesia divergens TaxID=32595 RepID=A0AAD9GHJ9_BABDI|nr:hypothetical protein X943_002245 [Babesia divergens]